MPQLEEPDAGTTGWVKIISQLSVVAAFITLFGCLLYWYRTDMREIVLKNTEQSNSFLTSLNTTNHLAAGSINLMDKMSNNIQLLTNEIKALREEVKHLKIARLHTDEPPKALDKIAVDKSKEGVDHEEEGSKEKSYRDSFPGFYWYRNR